MTRSRMDLQSRISARAVIAGVVSSFAMMFLLATFAGGLGFWEFNVSGPPQLNSGFWLSSSLAWIFSSFCGAFIAAFVGRTESERDGILYGFIAWASSCVLGCSVVALATGDVFGNSLTGVTEAALFSTFFGNILALGASFVGGQQGARYEAKIAQLEVDRNNEQRLAA
ncbi:MAG: hypothetical protein ACXVBL_19225 [Bdellovibrionota bacterium]